MQSADDRTRGLISTAVYHCIYKAVKYFQSELKGRWQKGGLEFTLCFKAVRSLGRSTLCTACRRSGRILNEVARRARVRTVGISSPKRVAGFRLQSHSSSSCREASASCSEDMHIDRHDLHPTLACCKYCESMSDCRDAIKIPFLTRTDFFF